MHKGICAGKHGKNKEAKGMAAGNDTKLIYKTIEKYIEELKKKNIDIKGAYLFGSYAKGNASEWSDIDLAVITNKFIGDSMDFRFLLMKVARDIDFNIEPHPYLAEDFNTDNPFVAEIIRTGKKVA